MCGTEQSKINDGESGGFFDSLWSKFVRDEKFDHKEQAGLNPGGKVLQTNKKSSPWSLSSMFQGTDQEKTMGVKNESDNIQGGNKGTYTPSLFKGFVKNVEATQVPKYFIERSFHHKS